MIALIVALVSPSTGQAKVADKPPVISDIRVTGNRSLNVEAIISASGLQIGGSASDPALKQAEDRLMAQGYFGWMVEGNAKGVAISKEPLEAGVRLTIAVVENPIVRKIKVADTGPLKEADLSKKLLTRIGLPLNLSVLRSDATLLMREYERKGYFAFIGSDVSVKDGTLTIPMVLAKVGLVNVEGGDDKLKSTLLKELNVKPGDLLNHQELYRRVPPVKKRLGLDNLTINFKDIKDGKVDIGVVAIPADNLKPQL
jgi:outer membrane protein assembly factor BamA